MTGIPFYLAKPVTETDIEWWKASPGPIVFYNAVGVQMGSQTR